MEYRQYITQAKNNIKNLSKLQKIIAFFACLLVVVVGIYFYNPGKKMLEMRNSQRRSDVASILNAAYQYASDHDGNLSFSISGAESAICRSGAKNCSGAVDFSQIVVAEKNMLSGVPVDPKENDLNVSGYQIWKSASGRINVSAPLAEEGAVISLSK